MKHILKCPECKSYGLKELCECNSKRVRPNPPKYNLDDKYGEYRRQAKKLIRQNDENEKHGELHEE